MYREYLEDIYKALAKVELHHDGEVLFDYESIMRKLVGVFSEAKDGNKHLFFIGNGGSAAIASHMTADFMKNGGMKTYGLYDSAVTTCIGNDYGYENIFEKPLEFLGGESSLLVAISSSGKSGNIIRAIKAAKKNKMTVLTLTGFDKYNPVMELGDYSLYVPVREYGKVETIHNLILQHVVDEILYRDGVQF